MHPHWAGRICLDLSKGSIVLDSERLQDMTLSKVANWLDQEYQLRTLSQKMVREAIGLVAQENRKDPVTDWLLGLITGWRTQGRRLALSCSGGRGQRPAPVLR